MWYVVKALIMFFIQDDGPDPAFLIYAKYSLKWKSCFLNRIKYYTVLSLYAIVAIK